MTSIDWQPAHAVWEQPTNTCDLASFAVAATPTFAGASFWTRRALASVSNTHSYASTPDSHDKKWR